MAKTGRRRDRLFQLRIYRRFVDYLLRTSKEITRGIRFGRSSEQSLFFSTAYYYRRRTERSGASTAGDASTDVGKWKNDRSCQYVSTDTSDQFGSAVATTRSATAATTSTNFAHSYAGTERSETAATSSKTRYGIDACGSDTG